MPETYPGTFESDVEFDKERVRAAAVYCSDGRFCKQVDDLLQNGLGLPRYDRLAVPGGAACLAGHFSTFREDEGVAEQLRFLIAAHELQRVVLVAHEGCAYYTVRLRMPQLGLERQQHEDLAKAARRVRRWGPHLVLETYFARKRHRRVCFERVEV